MKRESKERALDRVRKVVAEVNALYANGGPPKRVAWRMPEKCDDCPFHNRGKGLALRQSLRRWDEILDGLRAGNYFPCHQTAHGGEDEETGDYALTGKELVCAGSIEWQDQNGASSAYVRICRSGEREQREKRKPNSKRKRAGL